MDGIHNTADFSVPLAGHPICVGGKHAGVRGHFSSTSHFCSSCAVFRYFGYVERPFCVFRPRDFRLGFVVHSQLSISSLSISLNTTNSCLILATYPDVVPTSILPKLLVLVYNMSYASRENVSTSEQASTLTLICMLVTLACTYQVLVLATATTSQNQTLHKAQLVETIHI